MRLFIGIGLDRKAKRKTEELYCLLHEKGIGGNYTKPENLHLTLAFLGETDESKVPELKKIIASLGNIPKEIKVSGLKKMNDMLIGEIEKTKDLSDLHRELNAKLKRAGYRTDAREFRPHLTLIRKAYIPVNIQNIKVNTVSEVSKAVLFESVRTDEGLRYLPL